MVRHSGETLLACTAAHLDAAERTAVGVLVSAVRRDAPSVEIREMPAEALRSTGTEPADRMATNGTGPAIDRWRLPVRVAVPLALSEGSDITATLAAAAREDPTLQVARPLGPDWSLAEVVVRRLIQAGARKDDTIVLGVEGHDHPESVSGASRAARLVSAVWGGPVHIGAVGTGDTSVLDAIDVARAYGRRVVLASYVLAPGPVHDVLRRCGADLVTAPLLDGGPPDARLVQLVIDRFHQALGLRVPAL